MGGGAIDLPELQATPIEEIEKKIAKVKNTFNENKTRPVEYRLVQLRKLYWAIHDNGERIAEALRRDLGKPVFESYLAEIDWLKNDIVFVTRNLEKWAKDEKAPDISFPWNLTSPKIRKDPLGCVLVIGAFNYPFQLTLGPVIGAIAAGNTVVIKPSEGAPYSAAIMQEIIESTLDPESYTVVQGSVPEVQALLAERWDKIFFTGSANVGRIIAKAAAPHMTPVVLELGGMNPSIVTRNANARLVARRMLWPKVMNAGQICTSQNYLLVERPILPAVVEEFKKAYKEFYPNGAKGSEDYSKIANERSFQRIKAMIDNSKGKILMGGTTDEKALFIEPTLVEINSPQDSMVTEESFGPLIPILPVDSLDEALKISKGVQDTTLGVYAFGTKEETQKVLSQTRSGGASLNDACLHIPTLPFGGVGESGSGAYRGKASFDVFVHRRPVTDTPAWMERFLAIRYPPYAGKLAKLSRAANLAPDFDRNGQKSRLTFLRYLLTLGGGTPAAGATRAAALVVDQDQNGVSNGNGAAHHA